MMNPTPLPKRCRAATVAAILLPLACADINYPVEEEIEEPRMLMADGQPVEMLAVLNYSDGRTLSFWVEPPDSEEGGGGDEGDPLLASCSEILRQVARPALDLNTPCVGLFLDNTPAEVPVPAQLVVALDDNKERHSLKGRDVVEGSVGEIDLDADHLSVDWTPSRATWCGMSSADYQERGCYYDSVAPGQGPIPRCTPQTTNYEISHTSSGSYRKNTLTRSTFCDTLGDVHFDWMNAFGNWKDGATAESVESGSLITLRRYRKFKRRRRARHEAVWPQQMDILRGLSVFYRPAP